MVETTIVKKFKASSSQPLVSEWFRSSLAKQGGLDRAGEVRLLQHLLETTHDQLYRQAIPACDAVSLFLTYREIQELNIYFIKESIDNREEHVLYDVSSG